MADLQIKSERMINCSREMAPFFDFMTKSTFAKHFAEGHQPMYIFVNGNPQEILPTFSNTLMRHTIPLPKDASYFGYKSSESYAREAVAAALTKRRGRTFSPSDITITNGGFSALHLLALAFTSPGDEIMYMSPHWFYYSAIIHGVNCTPVSVSLKTTTWDLDLEGIAKAITPKTRAIYINSPHNPSGKILQPETLRKLANILEEASLRNGRRIFLFSDEVYYRITYEDRQYHSPTDYYPYSFIAYSYAKTMLCPGERLGYIAIPPCDAYSESDRQAMRECLETAQTVGGYAVADCVSQRAIVDYENDSVQTGGIRVDNAMLQCRRDRMISALRHIGYDIPTIPEGTYYFLVKSPNGSGDDMEFAELLTQFHVYVLPGSTFGLPGYFRVSLTATDDVIELAIPAFEKGYQAAIERDWTVV